MYILISIIGIIVTIFFVVGTHECAHFLVARLLNVKVLRFSIGFGKTMFKWHDKSGTEYVIAPIPLGGYVKMLDENEGAVAPAEKHLAFNNQPFYKKFLIVIAGPFANLLCAFLIYWVIYSVGFVTIKPIIGTVVPRSIAAEAGLKPDHVIISVDNQRTVTWTNVMLHLLGHLGNQDQLKITTQGLHDKSVNTVTMDLSNWHMNELNPDPLTSLGIKPYEPDIPLIIGRIEPNSPAALGNLHIGDKLIAVNGKPIPDWQKLMKMIYDNPSKAITLQIQRQNEKMDVPITIGQRHNILLQKSGFLGIAPKFKLPPYILQKIQYSPLAAISRAWNEMFDFVYFNFLLFGKLIMGKMSLQSLGGPITIFQTAGEALNSGFFAFFGFLAFLSIAIGVINLIPIPGLDGGHILLQIIEAIIRRPIPVHVLLLLYRLGFILLFLLLFQALMNDVLRMS